jgi:hypothetical protein
MVVEGNPRWQFIDPRVRARTPPRQPPGRRRYFAADVRRYDAALGCDERL